MKNNIIYLNSRLINIFANILKLGAYIFHFLFPNKRFTIPKHAKPLIRSNRNSAIPRTLWQTNYTDRVTLAVYINYLFNRLLSHNYDYRFMTTEDRAEFIKNNFSSDIFDNYSKIQIGAAQADLWRLLILYEFGGVYMDIDAHLVWPLSSIIKDEQKEIYIVVKNNTISNYFIASISNNSNLEKIFTLIVKNIEENKIKEIYSLTGPNVYNEILDLSQVPTTYYRHTCNQGNFTNEFFQYIDKAEGKWTQARKTKDVIKN